VFVWRVLRPAGGRPGPGLPLSRPVALRVPRPVYAVAVDATGHWLATLDDEGVRVWDLHSLPGAGEKSATPDGGLVHATRDRDADGRKVEARDLAFDPSGNRLAVAVGASVRVIDRSGKVLGDVPAAHDANVEAVAFGGRDGQLLATADANGLVKVWRVGRAGELAIQAELPGHTGPVYALAFSPDGRTLASGGFDRTVILWDPVTGHERAILTGHADRVLRVQFLPDSSALVTVARDGGVKRWRADSRGGSAAVTPQSPRTPAAFGE